MIVTTQRDREYCKKIAGDVNINVAPNIITIETIEEASWTNDTDNLKLIFVGDCR